VTAEEYNTLFEKLQNGEATEEERARLFTYEDEFELEALPWEEGTMGKQQETGQQIFARLQVEMRPVSRFRNIYRWGIAAAVLIGLLSVYLLLYNKDQKQLAVNSGKPATAVSEVIRPGGDKAVLYLGNGDSVVLQDIKNGMIAGVSAVKNGGQLTYTQHSDSTPVQWQTLVTPRGGQYHLILEDGTGVWLNASSSISFPSSFDTGERKVMMTGEAYFEVAHHETPDKKRIPFRVDVTSAGADNISVNVLGTHFNVMAYNNEGSTDITLLEGSVHLQKGNSGALLKPGQQASAAKGTQQFSITTADTDAAIAWKEGKFLFDKSASVAEVMRQLERWYDIEVAYQGNITDQRFWGGIQRSLSLDAVLEVLKQSGMRFRLEGRKLIVL